MGNNSSGKSFIYKNKQPIIIICSDSKHKPLYFTHVLRGYFITRNNENVSLESAKNYFIDYPNIGEVSLKNMGKCVAEIHKNWQYNCQRWGVLG